MKRAFIVTLDIPTDGDPEAYADLILDALDGDGLPVIDVDPWASHGDVTDLGIQNVLRNQLDQQTNIHI